MRRTLLLVLVLQAVTIGQQSADSVSDSLPAHSPTPVIKKAARHKVRAPLGFHILVIQMQSTKMSDYCVSVKEQCACFENI